MKKRHHEAGNTIIVAILTTALLSALVAIAVDGTVTVGRNAQRARTIATAVEIGDGAMELAFASWRKICSIQADPTEPLPAPTFAAIPTPTPGNFPVVPNFTVSRVDQGSNPVATISNFKVVPVDPLLTALPATSPAPTPAKSTGPGTGTFSYFYLASADVTIPAIKGTLTAKVRRVFEQRVSSPWNWAVMFNDSLEISPTSNLTLNGWVHTNGTLYTPSNMLTLTDRVSYVSDWKIGWHAEDTTRVGQTPTAPNASAEFPPGYEQPYLPFGWNPSSLINTNDTNLNNDSYREMVEKPTAGDDAWQRTRLWNQAAIAIEIDVNNNVRVYIGTGASKTDVTGTANNGTPGGYAAKAAGESITTGRGIQDNREQSAVRIVDFDVARFLATYPTSTSRSWNGIIYVRDSSPSVSAPVTVAGIPTTTTKRAIRVLNGAKVPTGGITIASDNPVYLQGDFNTGRVKDPVTGNVTQETPSNTGTFTNPEASGYTRQPALIAADAVTLLSNNWNDAFSSLDVGTRVASNTTVNAAVIAGHVPTNSTGEGYYSGGAENFVRFLEDWQTGGNTFTYYGSLVQFFKSEQANRPWGTNANTYKPASLKWYFDPKLTTKAPPSTNESQMAAVSYLQQQRWFVTFQPNP